tara:strand:- start:682 stop:1104 length:423 start_codon:yes stop_codon:yes gene_type:complete
LKKILKYFKICFINGVKIKKKWRYYFIMKVVLHLEQLLGKLPVFHVAIGYQDGSTEKRYDFHPKQCGKNLKSKGKKTVILGTTNKNFSQIETFEKKINKNYFLLKNDCRHYTKQLLNYSQDEVSFDVTNFFTLIYLYYFS